MQNKNKNLMKENTETGTFDKFFGILKSDKSVSLEEMDITAKKYAVSRIGGSKPFPIPDDFDTYELLEFEESETFVK